MNFIWKKNLFTQSIGKTGLSKRCRLRPMNDSWMSANSKDHDHTPQKAACDHGLPYLQLTHEFLNISADPSAGLYASLFLLPVFCWFVLCVLRAGCFACLVCCVCAIRHGLFTLSLSVIDNLCSVNVALPRQLLYHLKTHQHRFAYKIHV